MKFGVPVLILRMDIIKWAWMNLVRRIVVLGCVSKVLRYFFHS